MSRSGYSDDCEDVSLWRAAVQRAISGKRGQSFLREMLAAMDAMPERRKRLIADELVTKAGEACAIGTVAKARGLDTSNLDPEDGYAVANKFNIAPALAMEIAYINDEAGPWRNRETPEQRFDRVRRWITSNLRSAPDTQSQG